MKYWVVFINFIFWLLSYVKLVVIKVGTLLYTLYQPIYQNTHPTAVILIDWFNGKKTYIVSIFSIVGLLIAYKQGSVNLSSLLSTLPCLMVAITIRHGMARNAPNAFNEVPDEYKP